MKPSLTYLRETLTFLSHSITAVVVTLGHEHIKDLPSWVQWVLLFVYLVSIVFLIKKIQELIAKGDEKQLNQEVTKLKEELSKLERYNDLRRHMLAVIGEFIKERYKVNYDLAKKLTTHISSPNPSINEIKNLLKSADDLRRELVKNALKSLSSFLEADSFKKPEDVDNRNKDEMKVSFYAVEIDPSDTHQQILAPKARYYPNEGEPKTPKFSKGQGAAGIAWRERKTVVCENGGEDPLFIEMRPGQKSEYASMICTPAIMDIPAYKISEVYGILTIDSPIRRGYFQKGSEKFWADLLEPLCASLIYARESGDMIIAISQAISTTSLPPFASTEPQP